MISRIHFILRAAVCVLLATIGLNSTRASAQTPEDARVAAVEREQAANHARIVKAYPALTDPNSALAKAAQAVVMEWKNDPSQIDKLRRGDAPQSVLAEALLRTSTPPATGSPQSSFGPSVAEQRHLVAVKESAERAYAKYPDLRRQDSKLGLYFDNYKAKALQRQPDLFKRNNWPELLADACVAAWEDGVDRPYAERMVAQWRKEEAEESKRRAAAGAATKANFEDYAEVQRENARNQQIVNNLKRLLQD